MARAQQKKRNRILIVIASMMIVMNAAILFFVGVNVATFGWWSLLIAAGAITSIVLSVTAIKKNEPAWLLLDLILPN